MTKTPVQLVWLLVVAVLSVAAWRLLTLRESRSPDQQKLIDRKDSK